MATQIDVPVADTSVDVTDPVGAGKSLILGAVGFTILFAMIAAGRTVWNSIADQTDRADRVEVF